MVHADGCYVLQIVSIVHAVPLAKLPRIQCLMGAIMGLATVIGPLIGGGFTSNVSWRWCFYVNLPFGGVAVVAIFFFYKIPDRDTAKVPLREKLAQLDAPGSALLIPGVVCLLLALQWGGQSLKVS
jgi:MFS family permease